MKRNYFVILISIGILISSVVYAKKQKQIVGAVEIVKVCAESGETRELTFYARVDTGAKYTSINAEQIKVGHFVNLEGKAISFYIKNKQGQSSKIKTNIRSVVNIKTSEGAERRYTVPLVIKWHNSKKNILVTLNNRKKMKYGLLLGRNWLRDDFIVDIDINNKD